MLLIGSSQVQQWDRRGKPHSGTAPAKRPQFLISGFSFARSKKRAEDLRRRFSALGAGDRTRTGTLSPAADFEWLYRFCFPQQSALHRSLEALILLVFLIFSRFY